MPDFTSALYLGLRHPTHALRPWSRLTAGVPSALREPAESVGTARRLAALIGCESAVLGSSTLHLFWDLPALLGGRSVVLVEHGTYAIGRGGAQRAAAAGARVAEFAQHNPRALHRALLALGPGRRALIVIDSVAPGEDGRSPLPAYADLAKRFGALLVIDDTQALGILGAKADRRLPYGYGGGGSLRHHGLRGGHMVVIASLAKALGVPLAVLAGSAAEVARFSAGSETRTHSSPPSTASVRAAERALSVNRTQGDARRARLHRLVRQLRAGLFELGLTPTGGELPVQALPPVPLQMLAKLQPEVERRGLIAVPQRLSPRRGRLCLLVNAQHTQRDIAEALTALEGAYISCALSEAAA